MTASMTPSVTATDPLIADPLIVRKNGRRINAAGLTFQKPVLIRAASPARVGVPDAANVAEAEDVNDVNERMRREIARHVGDLLVHDAEQRAARRTRKQIRDYITVRDAVQDEKTQSVGNAVVADAEARAERARKAVEKSWG